MKEVWIFDENRRIYLDARGNKTQSPAFVHHWVKRTITSETSRSWVVNFYGEEHKIPKKDPPKWKYLFSEQELAEVVFIHDNALKIAEKVRGLKDYKILKQIADLVGIEASA